MHWSVARRLAIRIQDHLRTNLIPDRSSRIARDCIEPCAPRLLWLFLVRGDSALEIFERQVDFDDLVSEGGVDFDC